MENLMQGLLSEMNRVRDVIKEYEHPCMQGAGAIAAALMKIDIAAAEQSIAEGNVINMMLAYSKLKEVEL